MPRHDFGSFGQALRDSQVTAWRSFYLDYDRLVNLAERCSTPDRSGPATTVVNGLSQRVTFSESPSEVSEVPAIPFRQQAGTATDNYGAFVAELQRQVQVATDFFSSTLDELVAQSRPLFEQARMLVKSSSAGQDGAATSCAIELFERAEDSRSTRSMRGTLRATAGHAMEMVTMMAGASPPLTIPDAARAALHTAFVQLHRAVYRPLLPPPVGYVPAAQ